MPSGDSRGISRRDFVASAVAIGGSAALSACLGREAPMVSEDTERESQFPTGSDPASLPDGQHNWNEYLVTDAHGNTAIPQHQVVLGLEYVGSVPPTDEERSEVEAALQSLERAHQWGTGGATSASLNEGLLTLLGYSPRYFDRMDASVEGLTPPEDVLEAVGEDPSMADPHDAFLVLNSDYGSILLACEEALFGERDRINGQAVEGTFEDIFERRERRAGVVGRGNVADEVDNDSIPPSAPLSMGFRSGFRDTQPSEEAVTIDDGPMAGGTMLAASRLHIDLDRWYEQDDEERFAEMFSPTQDPADVGPVGDRLGSTSEITEEMTENVEEIAEEHGRLGHSQKVARARDEDFRPQILRRTEGVATDVAEGVGFNFHSIQATMDAFVETRTAMNVDEYDVDVADDDHGIVDYLETRARGSYVVPPRDQRALPTI
ncbi:hypothetical protein OB920_13570 [Halobacteria archaeon HArc-gm2]|nr:hypothetical protein [Halobacteria archaeon HArc-gm2]